MVLCALVTIYGLKFNIVTVESSEVFRVFSKETVHGIGRDGHTKVEKIILNQGHRLCLCLSSTVSLTQ